MQVRLLFVSTLLAFCCASSRQQYKPIIYAGSTPVDAPVRRFFGIPPADSLDFMRWELILEKDRYRINCQYGISKPNTSGFEEEHEKMLEGSLKKEGAYYLLQNASNTLILLEINPNLLYVLDDRRQLLVGNGGYSYVLNNTAPVPTDVLNVLPPKRITADSLLLEGRTPCRELSDMLGLGKQSSCFKLKWFFTLYTDPLTHQPAQYLSKGTSRRQFGAQKESYTITQTQDGRVIYELRQPGKKEILYLLQVSEQVFFFCNAAGWPMTGNKDFSFALNRRSIFPAAH